LDCEVVLDSDVNAAALAEYQRGAAKGLSNFRYVTVGTGIGGSSFIADHAVAGLAHPEMGQRCASDKNFLSHCPFYTDCAEGLASGASVFKRWGGSLNTFPCEHRAWNLQAEYLALIAAKKYCRW
jgi:fructokinase